MEQSSLPKPLVPFLQALTYRTLVLERETQSLLFTRNYKLYFIFNGKEVFYEVDYLSTNKLTGSKVQESYKFTSVDEAVEKFRE